MPQKIFMVLPRNGSVPFPQPSKNVNLASRQKNISLNSSMITRIHDLKPGCGSCGRKG